MQAQSGADMLLGSSSSSSSSPAPPRPSPPPSKHGVQVAVRIRPLVGEEIKAKEKLVSGMPKSQQEQQPAANALSLKGSKDGRSKQWKFEGFSHVFTEEQDNATVYAALSAPLMDTVMQGGTAAFMSYGHTGSGKTHTIVGYKGEMGLYSLAAADVCARIANYANLPSAAEQKEAEAKNPDSTGKNAPKLLVQVRFAEIYNGRIYDLLDNHKEMQLRENGVNGDAFIRGAVSVDDKGRVRVGQQACATVATKEDIQNVITKALGARAVGQSTVHSQSSRSHALLELEIVTPALADARAATLEREAELVPVGKERDDFSIAMGMKMYKKDPTASTGWAPSGYKKTKEEVEQEDSINKRLSECQRRLDEARELEAKAKAEGPACVGGTLVFADLAGADYEGANVKQDPKQKKEFAEINKSLLALKECIRALHKSKLAEDESAHVPFRDAKLTHVLKRHLLAQSSLAILLANVSPAASLLQKTVNTLSYAQLVAHA